MTSDVPSWKGSQIEHVMDITLFLTLWIILYGKNGKHVGATDEFANKAVTNDCQASPGNICLDENYDKLEIPRKPVEIESWIWIVQVSEVDYDQNTVAITAMITYAWQDNRLHNRKEANDTWQSLNQEWLEKIWYPSFFIRGLTDFRWFKSGKHTTGMIRRYKPYVDNELSK